MAVITVMDKFSGTPLRTTKWRDGTDYYWVPSIVVEGSFF